MNRALLIGLAGLFCPFLLAAVQPPAEGGSVSPWRINLDFPEPTMRVAQATVKTMQAPSEVKALLERVFQRIPEGGKGVTEYRFERWSVPGKPTDEAVGLLPVPGVDPDRFIARVMDVDHYVGNIEHVEASRSVANPNLTPPREVEFYQRVDIPIVGGVHQQLVLVDAGTIHGYRVAYWYMLKDETAALQPNKAARSDFNVGAWLVGDGVVGYTLSSWPKRDDVNWFQWRALTTGADLAASRVIQDNIRGMAAWAMK